MSDGLPLWADLGIAVAGFAGIVVVTAAVIRLRSVPREAVDRARASLQSLRTREAPTVAARADVTQLVDAARDIADQQLIRVTGSIDRALSYDDWPAVQLGAGQAIKRLDRLEHRRQR